MMIVHSKGVRRSSIENGKGQTLLESNYVSIDEEALALTWFYCCQHEEFLKTSKAITANKEPSENPKWSFMTLKAHLEMSKFSKAKKTITSLMEEDCLTVRDKAETYR